MKTKRLIVVSTTSFCLAILDRGRPKSVEALVQRARKLKLGWRDYDIRRAVNALRDAQFVRSYFALTPTSSKAHLVYELTKTGQREAKSNRLLAKQVFKRVKAVAAPSTAPAKKEEKRKQAAIYDGVDYSGIDSGEGS